MPVFQEIKIKSLPQLAAFVSFLEKRLLQGLYLPGFVVRREVRGLIKVAASPWKVEASFVSPMGGAFLHCREGGYSILLLELGGPTLRCYRDGIQLSFPDVEIPKGEGWLNGYLPADKLILAGVREGKAEVRGYREHRMTLYELDISARIWRKVGFGR